MTLTTSNFGEYLKTALMFADSVTISQEDFSDNEQEVLSLATAMRFYVTINTRTVELTKQPIA
jgi:hypothetical protein